MTNELKGLVFKKTEKYINSKTMPLAHPEFELHMRTSRIHLTDIRYKVRIQQCS